MIRRITVAALAVIGCASVPSPAVQPPGDTKAQFLRLSALTPDVNAQPTLMNARKVDPKLFPASFFAADMKCTSSLVGPRVLLTSAHCVADGGIVTIEVGLRLRKVDAVCTRAPGYDSRTNLSPDYALCLTESPIDETPVFETVNTDPARLQLKVQVLLTGFGCTQPGGGGDTSGKVYRVGEAGVITLPNGSENRFVVKGGAALCFGDSGGPSFLQRGKDGGPRIQVSVNSIGTDGDRSALASLSTAAATRFMSDWSSTRGVTICGVGTGKPLDKCMKFK